MANAAGAFLFVQKYVLTKNEHVSLANVEKIGLSKKYLELSCAPVTFSTKIDYQKEVFEKEEIEFILENIGQPEDDRRWVRQIRLLKNTGELAVKIVAQGAWFDLEKRKIMSPPDELKNLFIKFIGDPIST